MSTKEMEAMDNEVMGVVNGHAAPEAVTAAEEIAEREAVRQMNEEIPNGPGPAERENAPRMGEDPCEWKPKPDKAPQGKPDAAPEKARDDDYVCRLSKKEFEELSAKVETAQRRKTLTTVILCALLAAALLVVLAVPKLLIWLVNIGVASCAVIAGIAIDRRWRK